MGLALSVATGRQWLAQFGVARGTVLYVDCELHSETLANRVATIAASMGIMSAEFEARMDLLPLRGRLRNLLELETTFHRFGGEKYKLIVLDALYRLTPENYDENSNSDVTKLYNLLDRYAEMTGAAFVIVHHASKGFQSGKSVIDVGSGAGAQSRAADAHIVLRPHEEPGVVVMEAAVRSFAPLAPICLRWQWPTWSAAPECDPTALAQAKPRRIKAEQAAVDAEPPPNPWTPERFAAEFVRAEPEDKRTILARAEQSPGLSVRSVASLSRIALADRLIFPWSFANDRRSTYWASIEQPVSMTAKARK